MRTTMWDGGGCPEGAGSHVVHLYRRPRSLHAAVVGWIRPTLARGGGAILICTPGNAARVRAGLAAEGLDPAALEEAGRLAVASAEETLQRFQRDGLPDRGAFREAVGEMVQRVRAACVPGQELRAWGEMVDILRTGGNVAGALALEVLWGELIAEERLHLLCSYVLRDLDAADELSLWREVGATHGSIQYEGSIGPPAGQHPVPPALLAELEGVGPPG